MVHENINLIYTVVVRFIMHLFFFKDVMAVKKSMESKNLFSTFLLFYHGTTIMLVSKIYI